MTDMSDETNYKEQQQLLLHLYDRPGFKIRRLRQISEAVFNDACFEYSVTTTQYGILYALNEIKGVDQITIARLIGLDRSTAGLVIELLESRGLITRDQSLEDRRSRILSITDQGRQLIEMLSLPAKRSLDRLLDSLSRKEQKLFINLLIKLTGDVAPSKQLKVYQEKISALLQRPGFLIRRLHQKSVALFIEECREQNLTPTQYGILHVIKQCGPIDQITIARLIAIDRSTITLVVRLLVKRRLIDKSVDIMDKRRRTLVMTQEGLNVFNAAAPAAAKVMSTLLSPLIEDEQKSLIAMLDRMINRHEARFSTVPDIVSE